MAQLSGNHAALIWKKELIGPILLIGGSGNNPVGDIGLEGISDATINIAK